jgi:hypothetical protein
VTTTTDIPVEKVEVSAEVLAEKSKVDLLGVIRTGLLLFYFAILLSMAKSVVIIAVKALIYLVVTAYRQFYNRLNTYFRLKVNEEDGRREPFPWAVVITIVLFYIGFRFLINHYDTPRPRVSNGTVPIKEKAVIN